MKINEVSEMPNKKKNIQIEVYETLYNDAEVIFNQLELMTTIESLPITKLETAQEIEDWFSDEKYDYEIR